MITTVLKMVLMLTPRVLFLEDSDVASVKGGVLTIHNLDEDMVKVNRLSSSSSSQWSSSSCYHPSIHNVDEDMIKETGGAREVTVLKMEIQEIMKVGNRKILPYN